MSVEGDEASAAGAEAVQDSLRATIEKIIAFALTQSGAKTSLGTPVALMPSSVSRANRALVDSPRN